MCIYSTDTLHEMSILDVTQFDTVQQDTGVGQSHSC